MSSTQTIDDKINGYIPPQVEVKEAEPKEAEAVREPESESKKEVAKEPAGEKQEAEKVLDTKPDVAEVKDLDDVDDYGNPVAKARTYSEDEVQRMIRDRLQRGQVTQPPQAQVQQAVEGFEVDPNNADNWETQLEQFVEKTLHKVSQKEQQKQFRERELAKQADFESKFTTGMDKYKDFHDVVGKLPITDSIMMATREMKDPAAFLYAASKTQPDEVKRIASLTDPFHQATEIGRLEERMRKTRAVSQAAKPLAQTKSDTAPKYEPKRSIDQLIHSHAKSKAR